MVTLIGMKAVGNGRENPLTTSVTVFFYTGTGTGTGKAVGKAKSELRDAGNDTIRSEICR